MKGFVGGAKVVAEAKTIETTLPRTRGLLIALALSILPACLQAQVDPFMQLDANGGVESGNGIYVDDGPAYYPGFPADSRYFGAVEIGHDAAEPSVIRVRNSSYSTQQLSMLTPVVTGGVDFAVSTASFLAEIGPGIATTFEVMFHPTAAGTRSGQVTLSYIADPVGNPGVYTDFRINFEGVGVAAPWPRIKVTLDTPDGHPVTEGVFDYGPDALNFGTRPTWGTASEYRTVVVSNVGTGGPLSVGLPEWIFDLDDYEVDASGYNGSLMPGESTSFRLAFNPSRVAWLAMVIDLAYNDPHDIYYPGSFQLCVDATGSEQPRQLRVSDDDRALFSTEYNYGLPPEYIGTSIVENAPAGPRRNMGNIRVGEYSFITITISNAGTGYFDQVYWPGGGLVISSIESNSPDFIVYAHEAVGSIEETHWRTFTIGFHPRNEGHSSAIITIEHSDPSVRDPYRLWVFGFGAPKGKNDVDVSFRDFVSGGCVATPGAPAVPALMLPLLLAARASMRRRKPLG